MWEARAAATAADADAPRVGSTSCGNKCACGITIAPRALGSLRVCRYFVTLLALDGGVRGCDSTAVYCHLHRVVQIERVFVPADPCEGASCCATFVAAAAWRTMSNKTNMCVCRFCRGVAYCVQ
jgi:hypothetical protein